MADIKLLVKIPEEMYAQIIEYGECDYLRIINSIENGTPLTSDVLADLLMNERIRGELKQDISYSKDVIDNVKCKLTVDIIDHRPCYCSAGLREVWREREERNE